MLLFAACTVHAEDQLFVAPSGNDGWSGKLAAPNADKTDGPFATLTRAQKAVRELVGQAVSLPAQAGQPAPRKTIVVQITGGTYWLKEPVVFMPEDSGTAAAPVIYRAAVGETPLFSGGVALSGFKVNAQGRWELQIPEVQQGWSFCQLFVNGERRYRPRAQKNTYAFIAGPMDPSDPKLPGFDRFKYKAGDIKPDWKNLNDVEVLNFHCWYMSRFGIASVDDAKHVVNFAGNTFGKDGWSALPANQRYIVENVFEALQQPGEWYLDRKSGLLTYIPMPGEDPAKATVVAPKLEKLIDIKGDLAKKAWVENIRFEGLSFAHTNWTLGPKGYAFCQAEAILSAAITAVGARNWTLEKCKVAHVGTYAIEWAAGCKNDRVENCELTDLGAGGVKIGEMNIRGNDEEVASHCVVSNNLIAYGARVHPAAIGVWIGQSHDNSVVHNEIYDFYYTAVSVGWSWGYGNSLAHHNDISYNHMHKIGQGVLTDMGCIYTLGISPGTTLRYNHMHDVLSHSYGGWGIYFDEGSQGILAENNITYRCKSSGFHQHYGRENMVVNNIFAMNTENQLQRTRDEKHLSFTLERNLIYWKEGSVLGSNWSGDTTHFLLKKNLYWQLVDGPPLFAGKSFEAWQKTGQDAESIIADPLFNDPEKGDFTLKPGSPAEKIGFKPIDISTAGRLRVVPASVPAGRDAGTTPAGTEAGATLTLTPIKTDVASAYPPPPPPPPPTPISDGFEDTAVGQKPVGCVVSEDPVVKEANIRVTEETAASGKRSLKFTDAPGQKVPWDPHLWYEPGFKEGVLEGTFCLRLEPGAVLSHEWRTRDNPYQTGPSLQVAGDGSLNAGGKTLMKIPLSTWVKFEIVAGVGKDAKAKWDLAVTLPGEKEPKRFTDLPCSPKFKSLYWLGFVSNANDKSVFYIDDVGLKPRN
jgi:hypothetical protein